MDALLVIDMQCGMLEGAPKHDLEGVIERLNVLGARVRGAGGRVVFVQHDGPPGDAFARRAAAELALLREPAALAREALTRAVEAAEGDPYTCHEPELGQLRARSEDDATPG